MFQTKILLTCKLFDVLGKLRVHFSAAVRGFVYAALHSGLAQKGRIRKVSCSGNFAFGLPSSTLKLQIGRQTTRAEWKFCRNYSLVLQTRKFNIFPSIFEQETFRIPLTHEVILYRYSHFSLFFFSFFFVPRQHVHISTRFNKTN